MGNLFVVGIGPGGPDGMTIAARRALEAAEAVYKRQVPMAARRALNPRLAAA